MVGLAAFLVGGVLTALLAARLLPSSSYTVYAAFSGLLGVLVLGPASSLEQDAALQGARVGGTRAQRAMLRRVAAVSAVVALVVLVPVADWQERLLGQQRWLGVALVAGGAPFVLLLAVQRGLGSAAHRYRLVGTMHLLAGTAMLALPLVLYAGGLALVDSFLVGTVLAWAPPLLLALARPSAPELQQGPREQPVREQAGRAGTGWLVAANLLVLANLLAVPPLLRWHVGDLGPTRVADVQLLVSISRLATTAVLGFLPLLLGRWAAPGHGRRLPYRSAAAAVLFGLVAVGGAALLGRPFVAALTGRDAAFGLTENLLATTPVLLLCPALVLMGAALAADRRALVVGAWGAGLACLLLPLSLDPGRSAAVVLGGVLLAAAVPPAVLLVGLTRPRPGPHVASLGG